MCIYRSFIRPLLFGIDPEQAHNLAHQAIGKYIPLLAPLTKRFCYEQKDLELEIFGRRLNNPVGLAAGFDKNGALVHALKYLGFGFAEVGSISAQAHQGNPKPRLWRLPKDNALINWMGLNSDGAVRVSERLAKSNFSLPVALNLVKSNKPEIKNDAAVEDLLFTFRAIRYLPALYVVINISCVNTPDGILQETKMLADFLAALKEENANKLPVLVKVSEDGSDELIAQIVSIGKQFDVAGFVCGNTSRQRPAMITERAILDDIKNGGLSGPPIKNLVLPLCRKVYQWKEPHQVIIANGGISNGQDAYDYIRAGASLVELYTALIYEGPSVVRKICEELSVLLKRDGLSLRQAIGADNFSQVG